MYRVRSFPESNYRAIYVNGKTIRQSYNPKKPIVDLEYPEFLDISTTSMCNGKCRYCYQDSKPNGKHFKNILEKFNKYFGTMNDNQKPFQLAIGGGEATLHPDFIKLLELSYNTGITPNYTTNGMNLSEELFNATKKYCGGVAISCHEHLDKHWKKAVEEYSKRNIKTNLHIIISDKESVNRFEKIYNMYKDKVEYFVLLPHTEKGRAKYKKIEYDYLFDIVERLNTKQVAFGALFHEQLRKNQKRFDLSLYEPEIMSKYISFEGNGTMYKSSFCDKPIKENLFLEE